MEYNTNQPKLVLPEYGRNVQNMVDYAMTLTDASERQRCAETIIKVMAGRFPQQNGGEDFKRMLWDHLALISGYKLDVVSPCPISILTQGAQEHPHLDYPGGKLTFRHYGHTLEQMAGALCDIPEGTERQESAELVLAQMAKCLYVWNRNVLAPEKLIADLKQLTDGKIQLTVSPERMNAIMQAASAQPKTNHTKKKKK